MVNHWLGITLVFLGILFTSVLEGRDVTICPKIIRFNIYDIGKTDLPANELSRFNLPLSFSPRINNEGEIIYNTSAGGISWSGNNQIRRLHYENHKLSFFHSISENGSILASSRDPNDQPIWLVWPRSGCRRLNPICAEVYIDHGGILYYRDINSKGAIVGSLYKSGDNGIISYAVMRTPEGELNVLSPGTAWAVSDNNYLLANDSDDWSNRPYLWHPKGGKVLLSDNTQMRKPKGDVRYLDMAFGYDGSVYGSFYFSHKPQHLYPYHWEGCEDNFSVLDNCGIRITAVNSAQTMVGAINDRAVIKMRYGQTYDLNQIVNHEGREWLLVEATDINDLGQIVGYGYLDGESHIFLLEPTRPFVSYYITPK